MRQMSEELHNDVRCMAEARRTACYLSGTPYRRRNIQNASWSGLRSPLPPTVGAQSQRDDYSSSLGVCEKT